MNTKSTPSMYAWWYFTSISCRQNIYFRKNFYNHKLKLLWSDRGGESTCPATWYLFDSPICWGSSYFPYIGTTACKIYTCKYFYWRYCCAEENGPFCWSKDAGVKSCSCFLFFAFRPSVLFWSAFCSLSSLLLQGVCGRTDCALVVRSPWHSGSHTWWRRPCIFLLAGMLSNRFHCAVKSGAGKYLIRKKRVYLYRQWHNIQF
jgi:hypothetical protein